MPVLETPADCRIRIAGHEIRHLVSGVELNQFINDHHVLKVFIKRVARTAATADFDDPSTYTDFLGQSIAVTISPTGGTVEASKELEFIGVVTEVSLDNSIDGLNRVIVTAHSPTIAMADCKHNALYHETSASDMIGALVRGYPITVGNMESSARTLNFVVQYRETDWDFIQRLAGIDGKFAHYDGGEFRLAAASSRDNEDLIWRQTLGAFTIGVGTQQMEFKSTVYNYEQTRDYSSDSSSISRTAALSDLSGLSPTASAEVFGSSSFVESSVVPDASSLDQVLTATRSSAMGRMINCEGESIMPTVAVGHTVTVREMADLINRPYLVKSVKHVFDDSGKYHNTFICTPLDLAYPDSSRKPPRITQLQPAVVVNNHDPEMHGRIKVKFPWSGSDETPWVRYATMHAGSDRGSFWIPELNDEVLVGFEFGDPSRPIVVGSVYNSEGAPHSKANSEENLIKLFTTKSGNEIAFNDESGKESIEITSPDGANQIILTMDGPSITIKSTDGDITIEGKNIKLKTDEKVTVEAGTDLEMKASANMKLEASANFESKASGTFDAEGAMVNVKGNPIKLN